MIVTATMRRYRVRASVALALALAAAGSASALEVTNTANSGSGSLRAAVAAGGNVTFAASLNGQVIALTSGSIEVPNGTTINGPGAHLLSVDGNNAGRIFEIDAASSATIVGLRLVNGQAGPFGQGGAVHNRGVLIVSGVTISGNRAGDSGGGIYNAGTLDVRSSTLSGNSVTDGTCAGGGAIRSEGLTSNLRISNSTVSGNSVGPCNGGGISFNNGSAEIHASTITANTAGAGGGNLYKGSAAANLLLVATVVSDGVAGGGTPANTDLHGAYAGGLASGGYNLVRARGDATGFVATDFANGVDPQLAALGNNGGPTATHALAVTSPLFDAWTATCAHVVDQRGFARPQGDACDIGAFEYRQNRLGVTATGGGRVSAGATPVPLQGGIANCTATCTADYDGETVLSVTLTATPDAAHLFSGWSGDCSGTAPTTSVSMSQVRSCTATFVPATVVVTPSAGPNGSLSPSTPQVVLAGSTTAFIVTPDANHHIASVTGCGGSLSGNLFTTGVLGADCTVTASFAIDTHVVSASAGANGAITPLQQVVDHGSVAVFGVTPAANHHIANVTGCGGTLVGNTYTTAPVTADCAVTATFAIDAYTVSASAGPNGSVTPATQDVDHGEVATLVVTPDAHFHVDILEGCGGTLVGDTYTTAPVTADCEVTASFAIDTHTVGGTVSGLAGSGLVLRLDGVEDLAVGANGPFVFGAPVDSQSDYLVTVVQQPSSPAQVCSVANGGGTVGDGDVTDVMVSCVDALPELSLQVDDGREYARYGMLVDHVVTLHNAGNGDSGTLSLSGVASSSADSASILWTCVGAGDGATCTEEGEGPLVDSNVHVPAGRTLTWLVTVPVRLAATEGMLEFAVTAEGAAGNANATDVDALVLLRTGFDVQDDDGASAVEPVHCTRDARLDLASTQRIEWPGPAPTAAVEPILRAHDATGAGFRLERLGLDVEPRMRVVTVDSAGVERAGDWSNVVERTLSLGGVRAADGTQVLLVEGTEPALGAPLPAGTGGVLRATSPVACD